LLSLDLGRDSCYRARRANSFSTEERPASRLQEHVVFDSSTHFLIAHEWAYGLTEVFHIVSMAVGIGLIALVDLRVLGAGIPASPQRLLRATMMASMVGLIVAITSGFLILSTDPVRYVNHPTMRLKLVLIVVALVFNYTVHNRLVGGGYSVVTSRSIAAGSLAIWVTIVFSGIFYAFT
jgi:hypothetical protein